MRQRTTETDPAQRATLHVQRLLARFDVPFFARHKVCTRRTGSLYFATCVRLIPNRRQIMFPTKADLKKLRWQYRLLFTGLVFLCIVLTDFLLFPFGAWLARFLGIPFHAPLRSQPHGLVCGVLLLSGFVILLFACYFAVFGVLAVVLRWRTGWSFTQSYRLVFHSEVPPSWLKPPPHA